MEARNDPSILKQVFEIYSGLFFFPELFFLYHKTYYNLLVILL